VICTISPTCVPSLVCTSWPFYCFYALIFKFSNAVFTSCICSRIDALWFSTFSHTYKTRSLMVVAINSTSSVVSYVSISFMWAFSFFLEPLSCSPILFFWASNGLDASGIYVSMSPYYSISSSTGFSCVSVLISSACTYSIVSLGSCTLHGGFLVEPWCDFLCVLIFFWMGLLVPTGPCVIFLFLLVPFLFVCCEGIVLHCVWVCTDGVVFGIIGTSHSSGHSLTSIWMSYVTVQ